MTERSGLVGSPSRLDGAEPVLEVAGVTTRFRRGSRTVTAVESVSFSLRRGECIGLVGESGSGKSTLALSLTRLLPPGGVVESGTVRLNGRDVLGLDEPALRRIRGDEVGTVFQDPMSALNPTMMIGRQIMGPLRLHRNMSRSAARERALEVLDLVGVPQPAERLHAYPHQLSGGLRQRVMIAIALACEPQLLIADEPTTALDVSIQAQILDLIDDLRSRLSMAVILITHDLGVVATRTDRVMVMYAGRIVERGATAELLGDLRHPYTEALLEAVPRLDRSRGEPLRAIPGHPPDPAQLPSGCAFHPRCGNAREDCTTALPLLRGTAEASAAPDGHQWACFHPVDPNRSPRVTVSDPASPSNGASGTAGAAPDEILVFERLSKSFSVSRRSLLPRAVQLRAVSDVSFAVRRGETFGLVGESGSGKTTIGRMAVALERPTDGRVLWDGEDMTRLRGRELRGRRRDLQLVYQDPYAALDPRRSIGASIGEPLAIQKLGSRAQRRERVRELIAEVGLPQRGVDSYPHDFSGGQRQRVGLARALALNPRLVVADEPVSALDVSVQAQILNLMRRLQERHALTYVLISHDLSVVRYLSDRIGVMYLGKLVEIAPVEALFVRPAHPYTHGLMQAIPLPDVGAMRSRTEIYGEPPSPISPPSGCPFRTRCPLAQDRCAEIEPELRSFGSEHLAACHFPLVTPTAAGDPDQ
jgi:peptide/nickel transport system ATP-binding protein